ncbi:hypothetical protein ACQRC6_08745 [Peptoniphilus sp. SGI.035]|uniref:hypothetical protein n=1 Tax=Peptoniphilus sp. SGI.035 TaxID=3420564 RepID=UPI003D06E798
MNRLFSFFILAIFFSLYLYVIGIIEKKRGMQIDNSRVMEDYIYIIMFIEFWISSIFSQNRLYLFFAGFGIIIYFIYKTTTEDIFKNKYVNDPRLYKITTIFTQVIIIIYQLIFFINLKDGHTIKAFAKSDFLIILPCLSIVILWYSYFTSKRAICKIFVEKDNYRKIFITFQILFLLIFIFFSFYNFININRFDFYLEKI